MEQASQLLGETGLAPLALLKLTSITMVIFPALKSAAACALYIIETTKARPSVSALRRCLQFITEIQVE